LLLNQNDFFDTLHYEIASWRNSTATTHEQWENKEWRREARTEQNQDRKGTPEGRPNRWGICHARRTCSIVT
jgi:hypothetical protein